MSSVDNRIVQMEFDNKRFEANAKETMSTLDKLKEKLNFGNSAKGLEEFQNAANTFNLAHIANAIDEIGNKFTFMGQLGFQAMERIASAALNAGTALVKSISIDQISAGMSKYEQETNVIQTLYGALKPKGTKLDEIYEVMEKLTAYSDETSYSYTQMADAVSKFVNAGVDLEKAETVIEGISNAAALAGIGIHDTAIIYRNFADAIGRGGFKLQDWRSIQISHMDAQWLKQAFIDEAISQGKLDKNFNVKEFENSLSKGWLDTEVISSVMLKYATRDLKGFGKEAFAAAQNAKTFTDVIDAVKDSVSTGWSRSFRIIFGDLEEAIDFFTPMANKVIEFTSHIDKLRNHVLTMWKDLGGRDSMIGTLSEIWSAFERLSSVIGSGLTKALDQSLYPAWKRVKGLTYGTRLQMIAAQLFEITKNIENAAKAFNDWLSGKKQGAANDAFSRLYSIKQIILGIFSAINIVRMAFNSVFTFFGAIFKQLQPTFDSLLTFLSEIGWDLHLLNYLTVGTGEGFNNIAKSLAAMFEPLTSRLPKVVQLLRKAYDHFKDFWKNNKKFVMFRKSVMNVLNSFIKFVPKAIESIISFSKQIIEMVKSSDEWKALERNYTKYIKPVLSMLGGAAINFNNALADFFTTDTSDEKTMLGKLKKRFSAFDKLGPMLNGMWTALKKQIPWIQNVEDWWNSSPFIAGMRDWINAVGKAIDIFFSTDTSNESSLIGKLTKRFNAMWAYLGPWLKEKWEEFKKDFPFSKLLSKWVSELSSAVEKLSRGDTSGFAGIIDKIRTSLSGLWNKVGPWFESKWAEFKQKYPIIDKILDWFRNIPDAVRKLFNGDTSGLTSFVENFKTWFNTTWERLGPWFESKWATFNEKFPFIEKISVWISKIKEWVSSKIPNIGSLLENSPLSDLKDQGSMFYKIISTLLTWALRITNLVLEYVGQIDYTPIKTLMDWVVTNLDVAQILKTAAIIMAIIDAFRLIHAKIKLTKNISDTIKSIGNVFDDLDKSINQKRTKEKMAMLLVFVASVWALSGVLVNLSKLNWEELAIGLLGIAGLFTILGLFTIAMKKFNTGDGGLTKTMALIGIVKAVGMLADTLMSFKDATLQEVLNGLTVLLPVIAMLALVCVLIGQMNMTFTKSLGVILVVVSVIVLINTMVQALLSIKDIDNTKILLFGAALLTVGASMLILAGVVALFGKMDIGTIAKGSIAMVLAAAGLGAAIAILLGLVSQAIEDFSNTIALVGANLSQYSDMVADIDMDKVNNSITMLKDIATAFVEIGAQSYGSLEDFKTNLSHMGASLRLFYLTTEPVDIDKMKSIQTCLTDISGAFVTIGASEYGENLASFRSNLISMGSGLKLFQLSTAEVDIEQAKTITGALKEIATSLTGFPEVADIGTSIAHIGGAIKLYSESMSGVTLDTVPDSTSIKAVFDALNGAIPNDENLANAAAFATDDKGTQMTNFAIGLTNIATAVSTFSKNAAGLAFGNINKAIAALTALNQLNTTISTTVVSSYGSFSVEVHNQVTTGNLTTLATDMTTVATAVSNFSDSVKDSNFDQIDKAIAALTAINKLNTQLGTTTVVKIGSFSLELSEQKASMSTFSEDIILLGTALKDFGTNMSGVDLEKMDAGIAALGKIVELNNALPPTGGLKEMLVGSQDLTKFSANLKLLGAGTKAFSEAIAGENFNPDNIAAAGVALIKIAEVNTALPETGGISSWFTGDESLSGFAGSLKVLGEGIANFVKGYGNTKITDDVIAGINLLSRIANIQVKLGNATAWYSLATFGNEFSAMAESAVKANETLANMYLSWEDPTELIALVDGLANIQVKLGNIQFRKSLADLGNDMKLMFQNIYSFTQDSTWFSTTDTDRLQKVTDAISAILDSLGVFEGEASPLIQKGEEIIAMLAQGIGDDVSIASADSAVIRINNQIISTVKSYEQSFINVGTWIPAGISKGIWDNRYAAINAAIEVMNAAIVAAKETGEVASPSKVFAEIGMYLDMGLAQGFSDYIYLVDSAASEVTNSAINTVLQDMKAIQELPLDDMAIEPTIRPVLDMSNVAAGASSIDGLLGGSRSIGVDTRQLEASARLIDNSSGSDIGVISQQIVGLQEQIAQLEEAMTHFKMVMDTGALVGAIEADMDKALGERMRNGERGR